MAQVNHNVAYLTVVDGITIWERLRVIRNFLTDRKIAYNLTLMNSEKTQEEIDSGTLDKWKVKEQEIYREQTNQLIKDVVAEISFLEKLEAELATKAEETRIDGKSDDEMYEINYFEELIQKNILQVQSEMMAHGSISADTMKTLLKDPFSMKRVVELNFLSQDALLVANSSKVGEISQIGYIQ